MTLVTSVLALGLASLAQTASPTPASAPAPCSAAVHRQFDFWIGRWDVVNPQGKFAGSSRIERMGDCFLLENWSSAAGSYVGRSLNYVGFDGKWHQAWADTAGGKLDLVGGLVDGRMVLEGERPSRDPGKPGTVRNRITWSREPDGVVRQHWEASSDGGKSWSTAFDGRYQPAASQGALPDGFFRNAAGAWIGSGTVVKRDSHVELRIEPGVGATIRLHWRNVMGGARRDVFEGMAVYERKGEGEFTATWWDSQGARHAVAASADGASLSALWGDSGRTVYTLLDGGELEVVDSVKRKDGAWSEFGRTRLVRQ